MAWPVGRTRVGIELKPFKRRAPKKTNSASVAKYKYQKDSPISIDKLRRLCDLAPLKRKNRTCLACDSKFFSEHQLNRLCENCTKGTHERRFFISHY